jgi:hypothetical protein
MITYILSDSLVSNLRLLAEKFEEEEKKMSAFLSHFLDK